MTIHAINPATEEQIGEHTEHEESELENRVLMASDAFRLWRRTSFSARSERIHRMAGILREDVEVLVRRITAEMGKPIAQARAEVEKCAWVCDFYADNAEEFLAEEAISTDAPENRAIRPTRSDPGDHALELSLVAGVPLRRPRGDDRQRRRPQARPQCLRHGLGS